ncbi:MAG: PEP-CTERM sorting domain-containing protein [Phycisphaerales bacterium]|nr:MAG: PEP-CTERM sorting domain-containing protein [Phycisphaerales bacterium]
MSVRYLPFVWGLVSLFAPAAWAIPIDLLADPSFGSTSGTGATALVSLSFSEDGAEDLMTVSIHNTTPVSIGSKLTAVGLEIPYWISTSIDFAKDGESSYFDTLTFNKSVSPWWLDAPGGYDLMITSDGRFEGGSSKGAPAAGEMQTVVLSLSDTGLSSTQLRNAFAQYYAGLTDNYMIVRFQAVGPNGNLSDKVVGRTPEPSSLGLLVLGAGLLVPRRGRPGL